MKLDITFPEFSTPHLTRWLKRHHDGGGITPSQEDLVSVRDWLTSLPDEQPKMVSKLHKLNWPTAMRAQQLWHEAMARRAEQTKIFGSRPW